MSLRFFFEQNFQLKIPRRAAVAFVALVALVGGFPAFCDEIHDAAKDGDSVKLQKLLKHRNVLVSGRDSDGSTPLHLAAFYNHKDMAELLLAHGADVNAKDNFARTPLHWAANNGHTDVAEVLLVNKADVNVKDNQGYTPLLLMASEGGKALAELLLAHGADVNERAAAEFNAATPLHWAARFGHKDLAELLLAHGADVNAKGRDGAQPLYEAVAHGHLDVVELLLAKGADVNAKTNEGTTALMAASEKSYKEIRELLVSKGAVERTGEPLCTPAQVEEMVAELSRRISPFLLADAGNGFRGELDSKENVLHSSFGAGETAVLTIARPRSTGGRTSVEIYSKDGKLEMISFKILEANNVGFSAIWNAKPAVLLRGPTTAGESSGIGFNRVTLIKDAIATEYRIVEPNSWSVGTHPFE